MFKELMVTQDLSSYHKACSILDQNRIGYRSRISDRANNNFSIFSMLGASRRSSTGMFMERTNLQKFYIIDVEKKDLEYAKYLIRT